MINMPRIIHTHLQLFIHISSCVVLCQSLLRTDSFLSMLDTFFFVYAHVHEILFCFGRKSVRNRFVCVCPQVPYSIAQTFVQPLSDDNKMVHTDHNPKPWILHNNYMYLEVSYSQGTCRWWSWKRVLVLCSGNFRTLGSMLWVCMCGSISRCECFISFCILITVL